MNILRKAFVIRCSFEGWMMMVPLSISSVVVGPSELNDQRERERATWKEIQLEQLFLIEYSNRHEGKLTSNEVSGLSFIFVELCPNSHSFGCQIQTFSSSLSTIFISVIREKRNFQPANLCLLNSALLINSILTKRKLFFSCQLTLHGCSYRFEIFK